MTEANGASAETVFYSTPWGDTNDGEKRVFLLQRDGVVYMPVFRSEDSLRAFYTKANRAAYLILQGDIESLALLNRSMEQMKNTGFVIEPLSQHPVFIGPAATAIESDDVEAKSEELQQNINQLARQLAVRSIPVGLRTNDDLNIYVDGHGYHYSLWERGEPKFDRVGSLDDVLYWYCQGEVFASSPHHGDRRLMFRFEFDVLSRINPEWGRRYVRELAARFREWGKPEDIALLPGAPLVGVETPDPLNEPDGVEAMSEELQENMNWIAQQLSLRALPVGLGTSEGLNLYVDDKGSYHYAFSEGGKQTFDQVGSLDDVLFWYATTSSEPVFGLFEKMSRLNPEWGKRFVRERAHKMAESGDGDLIDRLPDIGEHLGPVGCPQPADRAARVRERELYLQKPWWRRSPLSWGASGLP